MLISMILIECRAQALIVRCLSLSPETSANVILIARPIPGPRYFCQEFQQNTDNGPRMAYRVMQD